LSIADTNHNDQESSAEINTPRRGDHPQRADASPSALAGDL